MSSTTKRAAKNLQETLDRLQQRINIVLTNIQRTEELPHMSEEFNEYEERAARTLAYYCEALHHLLEASAADATASRPITHWTYQR